LVSAATNKTPFLLIIEVSSLSVLYFDNNAQLVVLL